MGDFTDRRRYGSLTNEQSVSDPKLEHAVHSLAAGTVNGGEEAVGLQSLVVFCVAEALRFDGLAHDIDIALRTQDAVGGTKAVPLRRGWPTVHSWGQACDAIWAGLGAKLRGASLRPAAQRQGLGRSRYSRVDYARPGGLGLAASTSAAMLKRPAA